MFEKYDEIKAEVEKLLPEAEKRIEDVRTKMHAFSRSDEYFTLEPSIRLRHDTVYSVLTLFDLVIMQSRADYKTNIGAPGYRYRQKKNMVYIRDNLRSLLSDLDKELEKLPYKI